MEDNFGYNLTDTVRMMYCRASVDLDVGQFCSIVDGYAHPITLGYAVARPGTLVGIATIPMGAGEFGWIDIGIQFGVAPRSRWASFKDYFRKLLASVFPRIRIR